MNVRSQRADVGGLVAAHQGRIPLAYVSQSTLPDPGNLAAFMAARLADVNGLKLTRSAGSAPDVYDHAGAWLKAEGVDVERELAKAAREGEYGEHRAREAADRATGAALNLKAAEKRLLAEARGFNAGATGFTSATLGEAEARVAHLRAELEAACCDDPELARHVRRQVA
jgi:hypothetical protein